MLNSIVQVRYTTEQAKIANKTIVIFHQNVPAEILLPRLTHLDRLDHHVLPAPHLVRLTRPGRLGLPDLRVATFPFRCRT